MPSIDMWRQLQAASGLAFAFFLTIHLFSHLCLNLGWEYGRNMMSQMRGIYQHPVFETQLLLVFLVHLTSAGVLYLHRKKVEWTRSKKDDDAIQTYTPGPYELQLHRYAGHFLATAIFGHVFSTRIAALLWLPDPALYDYSFITELQERIPYNLFTIVMYVLGAAGFYHLLYGVYIAPGILMKADIKEKKVPSYLLRVALIGNLAVISTILALKGKYYGIDMTEKQEERDMLLSKMGL
ncbi:hypothetical protein FisN_15Hh061 [Fistulifera solaris]|uniref:Succinate dehydrogenase cytochrome b subunit n=1 Tax=Fistulifera solaris TaxID=1519565 RepID=A0A1Z5K9U8_FISSO|nr:hypothetical protein FisN_15Hh061 [Fistulifera solaris]|eukprot:GAX23040.1 hypothetical protein FisN_15Hh061 [Fistulifera solaris]